jgi:hypothetical protein
MRWFALCCLLWFVHPANAGLQLSLEQPAQYPVAWRGYLLDLKVLRSCVSPGQLGSNRSAGPLREWYVQAALDLQSKAKQAPLGADQLADLGALHLRLGDVQQALDVLRPACREHGQHFAVMMNTAVAWFVTGDLAQAESTAEEACELADKAQQPSAKLFLRLCQVRRAEPRNSTVLDALFPSKDGKPAYPPDALALLQELCATLPSDARLLWQLAEVAHAEGYQRVAKNILDGCVTELGITSEAAREQRKAWTTALDAAERSGEHQSKSEPQSFAKRLLPKRFDPNQLPEIQADKFNPLPWAALDETTIGKGFAVKFLKYVEQLDGLPIRMTGSMQPLNTDSAAAFYLLEYPIGCWFCELPGPLQIMDVELADGVTTTYRPGVVVVEGTLQLNRTDPERLLFRCVEARVKLLE